MGVVLQYDIYSIQNVYQSKMLFVKKINRPDRVFVEAKVGELGDISSRGWYNLFSEEALSKGSVYADPLLRSSLTIYWPERITSR